MVESDIILNCLSLNAQKNYRIILQAMQKKEKVIRILNVGQADVVNLISCVLQEHPEIIYCTTNISYTKNFAGDIHIHLNNTLDLQEEEERSEKLKRKIKQIIFKISQKNYTAYDRIRAVYEYLQENCKYDKASIHANNLQSNYLDSGTAYGALIKRQALCSGISAAFALICQSMGFKCCVINGNTNEDRHSTFGHAWNLIQFHGEYYHLDCTWDINNYEICKVLSYEYFFRNDIFMSSSHQWSKDLYPECLSPKMSLYYREKWIAMSENECGEIIQKTTDNNKRVIRLQLSHNIKVSKENSDIFVQRLVSKYVLSKNYGNSWSFSYNDRTRCIVIIIKD